MESKKKILKRIFIISILTFFIVGGFILLTPNKKRLQAQVSNTASIAHTALPQIINETPEAATHPPVDKEKFDYCQALKEKLPTLSEFKKNHVVSERFINIHKKVNGTIFRLRFFYKDHAEGETPTYLLYIEDPNDVAHLIEKSSYKKGPEYRRIEKAAGEIIYTEKGINVGTEETLFLHYVNSSLKGLQGTMAELDDKAFIDCRF